MVLRFRLSNQNTHSVSSIKYRARTLTRFENKKLWILCVWFVFWESSTNWSYGLERASDDHRLTIIVSRLAAAVYSSVIASLQSCLQFSHDHSRITWIIRNSSSICINLEFLTSFINPKCTSSCDKAIAVSSSDIWHVSCRFILSSIRNSIVILKNMQKFMFSQKHDLSSFFITHQ